VTGKQIYRQVLRQSRKPVQPFEGSMLPPGKIEQLEKETQADSDFDVEEAIAD
jgi:hypothetical protein